MSRAIALLLLAALLSSCVLYERRGGMTREYVTIGAALAIQAPPARYDHAPRVDVAVMTATRGEVHRLCRSRLAYHGRGRILACALPVRGGCLIVWPRGVPRSGTLWRHEIAHCNGWRHP